MIDENEKYYVSLGMRTYGGSFIRALGEALSHADHINREIIKKSWKKEWDSYLEKGIAKHEHTESVKYGEDK